MQPIHINIYCSQFFNISWLKHWDKLWGVCLECFTSYYLYEKNMFLLYAGDIPISHHCSIKQIPWIINTTRQIWGIWKLRPAYSPETPNFGQNRWCFVSCDLEICWMTLENNRASLLCCFKLCATFHSHWWIQTGITVRKRPIWVKIDDF